MFIQISEIDSGYRAVHIHMLGSLYYTLNRHNNLSGVPKPMLALVALEYWWRGLKIDRISTLSVFFWPKYGFRCLRTHNRREWYNNLSIDSNDKLPPLPTDAVKLPDGT